MIITRTPLRLVLVAGFAAIESFLDLFSTVSKIRLEPTTMSNRKSGKKGPHTVFLAAQEI
jgi:hypothetical protein